MHESSHPRAPFRFTPGWLGFLPVCVCLAVSALHELIEWWTASIQCASAEAGREGANSVMPESLEEVVYVETE